MRAGWEDNCRLMLITDGAGDVERIVDIVRAAVGAGVRAVQVREEKLSARVLAQLCDKLRHDLEVVGGLLLVNDRADVGGACAHGVHLGLRSLRPSAARRLLGPDAVIGFSAHDLDEARWGAKEGADYVSLSPVFATESKPESAPLGVERARSIVVQSDVPVIWLGGIDVDRMSRVVPLRPFGVGVMSAISLSPDPGAASAALLDRLHPRGPR